MKYMQLEASFLKRIIISNEASFFNRLIYFDGYTLYMEMNVENHKARVWGSGNHHYTRKISRENKKERFCVPPHKLEALDYINLTA